MPEKIVIKNATVSKSLIIDIAKLNHPDETLGIGSENQKPPVIFGTEFLDIGPQGPRTDGNVNLLPMKTIAQAGLLQKCHLVSCLDQQNSDPRGTICHVVATPQKQTQP
jgi:hypothetical protein